MLWRIHSSLYPFKPRRTIAEAERAPPLPAREPIRAGRKRTRQRSRPRTRRSRAPTAARRASSRRRHPHDRVRPSRSDAARTTISPPHMHRQRHRGRRGGFGELPARAMTVRRSYTRPRRLAAGGISAATVSPGDPRTAGAGGVRQWPSGGRSDSEVRGQHRVLDPPQREARIAPGGIVHGFHSAGVTIPGARVCVFG